MEVQGGCICRLSALVMPGLVPDRIPVRHADSADSACGIRMPKPLAETLDLYMLRIRVPLPSGTDAFAAFCIGTVKALWIRPLFRVSSLRYGPTIQEGCLCRLPCLGQRWQGRQEEGSSAGAASRPLPADPVVISSGSCWDAVRGSLRESPLSCSQGPWRAEASLCTHKPTHSISRRPDASAGSGRRGRRRRRRFSPAPQPARPTAVCPQARRRQGRHRRICPHPRRHQVSPTH